MAVPHAANRGPDARFRQPLRALDGQVLGAAAAVMGRRPPLCRTAIADRLLRGIGDGCPPRRHRSGPDGGRPRRRPPSGSPRRRSRPPVTRQAIARSRREGRACSEQAPGTAGSPCPKGMQPSCPAPSFRAACRGASRYPPLIRGIASGSATGPSPMGDGEGASSQGRLGPDARDADPEGVSAVAPRVQAAARPHRERRASRNRSGGPAQRRAGGAPESRSLPRLHRLRPADVQRRAMEAPPVRARWRADAVPAAVSASNGPRSSKCRAGGPARMP